MVGLTTSSKVLQPEKEGDVRGLEVCENGRYITDRGIEALLVKVGCVVCVRRWSVWCVCVKAGCVRIWEVYEGGLELTHIHVPPPSNTYRCVRWELGV